MITEFTGQYRFLSNFWDLTQHAHCVKCSFGITYPTVEHAYQASKSINKDIRLYISHLSTPDKARKEGRELATGSKWDRAKVQIMEDLVRQKFTGCNELKDMLLSTGIQQIMEGNRWNDTFWGAIWTEDRFGGGEWVGENHLGKILMKIREELRNE